MYHDDRVQVVVVCCGGCVCLQDVDRLSSYNHDELDNLSIVYDYPRYGSTQYITYSIHC